MSSGNKDDPKRSPNAKRGVRGIALFATLGWIAAALLIADKIHVRNMTASLHNALVRSQTERHELSQELERKSEELGALHERLSKYENRETQAAAHP